MASHPTRSVSVQRTIAAPAEKIFAVLAAPSTHWAIDGTDSLRPVYGSAPSALRAGSVFTTPMSRRLRRLQRAHIIQVAVAILVRGRMRNTVVEFEENKRIAWRNFGRHIWRYELEPTAAGEAATLVKETFDYAPNLAPWLLEWAGFPSHNARAMTQTLRTLDDMVTTGTRQ